MIKYTRQIEKQIEAKLFKGKVIIIYGPRQVGKTTLVKKIITKYGGKYFSCDDPFTAERLTNKSAIELKAFLGNEKLIVLDEAQSVENIGITLKLLVDNYPEIQIIATGSSSFELANKINEPLTGRNWEFHLYSISVVELLQEADRDTYSRSLEQYLVYGTYPEVLNNDDKIEILQKIAQDYLYKDMLTYSGIRNPKLLRDLLRLLALQLGNEVSYNELATLLQVKRETVISYITLLAQAFIIFELKPLQKNKRNEIKQATKIYFWDLGIRNTIINNLNPLVLRTDAGALFENYFIAEKLKDRAYKKINTDVYFWRTRSQQEIDFIEEYRAGEEYKVYECKWKKTSAKVPTEWAKNYNNYTFNCVNRDNLAGFFME